MDAMDTVSKLLSMFQKAESLAIAETRLDWAQSLAGLDDGREIRQKVHSIRKQRNELGNEFFQIVSDLARLKEVSK